jgi:glycosyltransferase involved in cell wall biosynthesis
MIAVLLATYNGQAYLPAFLDSLRRQTVADWVLLAGDDTSDDATAAILYDWSKRDPRIRLISGRQTGRGAAANFGRLMQHACETDAEFVFFADQDDVWLLEKMERQLQLLRLTQTMTSAETPVLVHSDLVVTDENLRTIHPSLMRHAGFLHAECHSLQGLLLHNCVTGCTTAVNRRLLELATPVPREAVMHDWWLALCAAAAGRIAYLPESTVLYRQHAANAIGGRDSAYRKAVRKITGGRRQWERDLRTFRQTILQARALRDRLRDRGMACAAETTLLLDEYCRLFEEPASALKRIAGLRRLGVPAAHPLRQALSYLRVAITGDPLRDVA